MKRASRQGPGGFTLLEVLVSLGLSVLLVTAIYGAISTYIRVSQGDQGKLERSRVARSLFRQISLDIQSVLFRVEEESTESTESTGEDASSTVTTGATAGTGTESETDTETTETTEVVAVVDPEAALQSSSVGLIGDAGKLTLHVNRPARELSYTTLQSGSGITARTSDLQSITWFLADASASGLEGEVGQLAQQGSALTLIDSGPQGLARLAGDRMAIEYADVESDVSSLAAAARVLAPEVVSLQFRYFDGLTWLEEWDSVSAQRLPNAVEITLGLKRIVSEEERLAKQFDATARAGMDEIVEYRRHVVSLPLAEPYTEGL
jgi:prepilin-type N-terminal cleavage/methylation domain-containing protein